MNNNLLFCVYCHDFFVLCCRKNIDIVHMLPCRIIIIYKF